MMADIFIFFAGVCSGFLVAAMLAAGAEEDRR